MKENCIKLFSLRYKCTNSESTCHSFFLCRVILGVSSFSTKYDKMQLVNKSMHVLSAI